MNRKYYASEHQRGAADINRSLHNDVSDRDRYDSSIHERDYSQSLRMRNRATTLDDIEKVNRYVEDLSSTEEFKDPRSERVRNTRLIERPLTPPPPVISFDTDGRNRREREDPQRSKKIRRRNSRDRSASPRHNISYRSYADESEVARKRRRKSNDIELSPLERALNRGSSSYMRNRQSSIVKDFEEMYYSHRSDRREHKRRNSVERSSLATATPARKPKDLILTVIDEGPNYNHLGQMRWRLVESALCMIYLDIMRQYPGPPPVCRDAGWFLGCAKLIECADERSLQLYQLALSRLGEVWPGARLKVVNRNEITTSAIRVRCATFVSAEPSDKHAILDCIQHSNPDLPTSDWRVISVGAPSRVTNERHIIISFGIESLPFIEERRGIIKYGFESITLKINKRDKDLWQRVTNKGHSHLSDMEIAPHSKRPRTWSGMEEADEVYQLDEYSDVIMISDSEEDEGSDYS